MACCQQRIVLALAVDILRTKQMTTETEHGGWNNDLHRNDFRFLQKIHEFKKHADGMVKILKETIGEDLSEMEGNFAHGLVERYIDLSKEWQRVGEGINNNIRYTKGYINAMVKSHLEDHKDFKQIVSDLHELKKKHIEKHFGDENVLINWLKGENK